MYATEASLMSDYDYTVFMFLTDADLVLQLLKPSEKIVTRLKGFSGNMEFIWRSAEVLNNLFL